MHTHNIDTFNASKSVVLVFGESHDHVWPLVADWL